MFDVDLEYHVSAPPEVVFDHFTRIELMAVGQDTTARIRQTASSADEQNGYVEGWTHFVGRLTERLAG